MKGILLTAFQIDRWNSLNSFFQWAELILSFSDVPMVAHSFPYQAFPTFSHENCADTNDLRRWISVLLEINNDTSAHDTVDIIQVFIHGMWNTILLRSYLLRRSAWTKIRDIIPTLYRSRCHYFIQVLVFFVTSFSLPNCRHQHFHPMFSALTWDQFFTKKEFNKTSPTYCCLFLSRT